MPHTTMEQYFFQASADTSIHARITRPKMNHNPLLIFLHYWGGSSSTWHKLTSLDSPTSISALYPTIAIDLRGWGQSKGPSKDNGTSYSITSMAVDVLTLLAHLKTDSGKRNLLNNAFVLVGHSMGAKVALAALSTLSPELLDMVKGLVLVAPAPPSALDLPPEMKAQQQVAYESAESIRWTVENVLANTEKLDDSDIEMAIRDSLAGNPFAKKAWPSYGMQEDVSSVVKTALLSTQGRLPATVLVGELDVVEPKERVEDKVVRYLKDSGIQVSLKVVKGAKHLIPLENPTAVYEELCRF